jgi:hypothetical protein
MDKDTFKSVLDLLWTQFILRDIFSMIIPGMIILIALTIPFLRRQETQFGLAEWNQFIKAFPIWAWLGVFGLAWLLGIAVEGLGHMTELIQHAPIPEANYDALMLEFLDKTCKTEKTRLERFQVIREASSVCQS